MNYKDITEYLNNAKNELFCSFSGNSLAEKYKNKIGQISSFKESNLIISLDLTCASDILEFIKHYGDKVVGIKLHSDIITYDKMTRDEFILKLTILKRDMNFILIEDRKFCDIGNTVRLQSDGITKYADLITVHAIPGQGIISGLEVNCKKNNCGILLISQMSTKNNLISNDYTENVKKLAFNNKDVVVGFICQEKMCDNNEFIHFSPGVKLLQSNDGLGQEYSTPESLYAKGINFFIVGRDIYDATQPSDIISNYNGLHRKHMQDTFKDSIIESGIIKTGNFVLSSGETSSIYADFRLLNSNPSLLKRVAQKMSCLIPCEINDIVLMGVPMGGIPLATALSLEANVPFVIVRDKRKEYGSKNLIEGMSIDELRTKTIILVEDVITTGGSVEKIINKVKCEENLDVKYVMCILDRCKGGNTYITNKYNVPVLKLFSLSDFQ